MQCNKGATCLVDIPHLDVALIPHCRFYHNLFTPRPPCRASPPPHQPPPPLLFPLRA